LDITETPLFMRSVMVLILLNSLMIGIQADQEVKYNIQAYKGGTDPIGELPLWQRIVDLLFTIAFTVELTMRIIASGLLFFTGYESGWNILDTLLVLMALIENLLNEAVDLSFMRVLRVLRTIRAAKVIRAVRFLTELRVLLMSIVGCIWSIFWALVFLVGVLFIYAVLFSQGAAYAFTGGKSQLERVHAETLMEDWGTLVRSALMLFMLITGGSDWGPSWKAFNNVHVVYGLLFVVFIGVTVIGVMNVIIGIFADGAIQSSAQEKDEFASASLDSESSALISIRRMLHTCGKDRVSWDCFLGFLEDEEFKQHLHALKLSDDAARSFFRLIDTGHVGEVHISEFIVGLSIFRCRERTKTIDLLTLWFEEKQLMSHLKLFMRHTEQRFNKLQTVVKETQAVLKVCTVTQKS